MFNEYHKQLYDYFENSSNLHMNDNMAFVQRHLLLRPFYISYNTCIYKHIGFGNV